MTNDEKRYAYLRSQYVAADFRDDQFPAHVVLKFAVPKYAKVSADIDATIDALIATRESLGWPIVDSRLPADEVSP